MRDFINIVSEGYGSKVKFYKNPSPKLAARLMDNSYYHELRATFDTYSGNLWLWEAHLATHHEMGMRYEIEGINLEISAGLIRVRIGGNEGSFIQDNIFQMSQFGIDHSGLDERQAMAALAEKMVEEIVHSPVPKTFPGFRIEPEFVYIDGE